MKKIFINGDKWALTRIDFKDWKPYEVKDDLHNQIVSGEIFIDPEKTTEKKLVTRATPYVNQMLHLAQAVFSAYEAEKNVFNSDDYKGNLTISDLRHLRDEIQIVQEIYNETGKLPSLETVGKRYPEIQKLLSKIS